MKKFDYKQKPEIEKVEQKKDRYSLNRHNNYSITSDTVVVLDVYVVVADTTDIVVVQNDHKSEITA